MELSHFEVTDVGRKRDNNEDSVLVNPEFGLYLVADGMGGHAAGEVASRLALESVESFFINNTDISDAKMSKLMSFPPDLSLPAKKLLYSIMESNNVILKEVEKKPELRGMGTTIVALHPAENEILLGHVGDSRVYRVRRGRMRRMTEDHSLFERELKKNVHTRSEIDSMPERDSLTRALGHMPKATVDLNYATPRANDIFILCSDGLTDMVSEEGILDIVAGYSDDIRTAGELLLHTALKNGGVDNISIILVKVE
jgi:protein phosphatase